MTDIIAYTQPPDNVPVDSLLHSFVFGYSAITTSQLRVVWDLSSFVSRILSLLPDTVRAELSRPPHRSRWGSYRLYYITDKVFSINKNGSEVSFYDLSQYYPGDPEPETLDELQQKADLLSRNLSDLGIERPRTLASPVAIFRDLAGEVDIPTVFDATQSQLEMYDIALQCTPREWVSNYQVGAWLE